MLKVQPAEFCVIAGPCVVEPAEVMEQIASRLCAISAALGIKIIFKASAEKANRSSGGSYRGPGWVQALGQLQQIKQKFGLPILTDIHECWQADEAAAVADVLQIPALLSRQTELIEAAAKTGRVINVKKGQFMAPGDMMHVAAKAAAVRGVDTDSGDVWFCERGNSFGYHNVVADMRNIAVMRASGNRVIFDASHTVQLPGANGNVSGGQREFTPVLARAAMAAGADGLFVETHPVPDAASSDAATAWPLDKLQKLIEDCQAIHRLVRSGGMLDAAAAHN
jgi:2-dehydro-3-deoxyphosphooctonate aldolase (KDO 8-P synthase)